MTKPTTEIRTSFPPIGDFLIIATAALSFIVYPLVTRLPDHQIDQVVDRAAVKAAANALTTTKFKACLQEQANEQAKSGQAFSWKSVKC